MTDSDDKSPTHAWPSSQDADGQPAADLAHFQCNSNDPDWVEGIELALRIRRGSTSAERAFSARLEPGLRLYFKRHNRQIDVDSLTTRTLTAVLSALRGGELRESDDLGGWILQFARRESASAGIINKNKNQRYAIVDVDREMRFRDALDQLSELAREVLARFYIHEQSCETICKDLGLTEREFRNIKWAAKATVMCHWQRSSTAG